MLKFFSYRTELRSLDQRSAGCRFDGHGYVISDARSTNLRHRFTVELKFKTSEPQGLLFLVGGNKTFSSLELRNGKVLYQVGVFRNHVPGSINFLVPIRFTL